MPNVDNPPSTHWRGCWLVHHECAIVEIRRMQYDFGEVLEQADRLARQSERDRLAERIAELEALVIDADAAFSVRGQVAGKRDIATAESALQYLCRSTYESLGASREQSDHWAAEARRLTVRVQELEDERKEIAAIIRVDNLTVGAVGKLFQDWLAAAEKLQRAEQACHTMASEKAAVTFRNQELAGQVHDKDNRIASLQAQLTDALQALRESREAVKVQANLRRQDLDRKPGYPWIRLYLAVDATLPRASTTVEYVRWEEDRWSEPVTMSDDFMLARARAKPYIIICWRYYDAPEPPEDAPVP